MRLSKPVSANNRFLDATRTRAVRRMSEAARMIRGATDPWQGNAYGRMHMTDRQQVWWRPQGRSPFSLDPNKPRGPQIASAIGQCAIIFGGPALGLVAITYYRGRRRAR